MIINMAKDDKKQTGRLPGFYIALCCCVLVIGIAGYFTERQSRETVTDETAGFSEGTFADSALNAGNQELDGEVISVGEVTTAEDVAPAEGTPETEPAENPQVEPAAADLQPSEAPAAEEPVPTAEPEYTKDNPDVMETAVNIEAEEAYFSFPAGGEILAPFSSVLSFNEALGDYRTHNGIDIAADEGCSISAAADGTVDNIFSNAFGEGVSISHSDGFVSKYMCLGAVEGLKIGDTVKRGDVIGTVGESKGENTKEPHLHFEMYKNGEPVDPTAYLN